MKRYESPKVEFEKIVLNEKIANTCWGYHGTGTELYYDYKGTGYIGFTIAGGSCTFSETNITVKYYDVPVEEQQKAYNEFYQAVISSGGASGNPFKGEGTVILPNPDPTWS